MGSVLLNTINFKRRLPVTKRYSKQLFCFTMQLQCHPL